MKRKIAALVMSLAMTASLVACGGTAGTAQIETVEPQAAAEETAEAETEEAAPAEEAEAAADTEEAAGDYHIGIVTGSVPSPRTTEEERRRSRLCTVRTA